MDTMKHERHSELRLLCLASSVTHCLVNGADRDFGCFASKDTGWRSSEPRDRGARGGVLGARMRTEGRSGGPEEQRASMRSSFGEFLKYAIFLLVSR